MSTDFLIDQIMGDYLVLVYRTHIRYNSFRRHNDFDNFRSLTDPIFQIHSENQLEMDGELYHFEESQYCLKIENFDVYSKLVKHQDSLSSLMMTLHAQLNPK